MRIGVLTFTYRKDEDVLKENNLNMKTLREKYPEHEIIHFIADDSNNPFEEKINDTDDIRYFQTSYNRGGNLNGIDNFIGQVQTLKRIQLKHDFDYIVKLDSDTCLINLSVLGKGIDYGGSSDKNSFYAWGPAYFMSRKCLACLFNILERVDLLNALLNYPPGEDVLTGAAVYLCNTSGLNIKISNFCTAGGIVPYHFFESANPLTFAAATKVGSRFKDRINQSREDIFEKMKICRKLIVNNNTCSKI